MSFEGYVQLLCDNGHQFGCDCYQFNREKPPLCPICDKHPVWENLVDLTNGSFDHLGNRIDNYIELDIIKNVHDCRCSCCGGRHQTPAIYEIPKNKGRRLNANNAESRA